MKISLGEDLYSMFFASTLDPSYVMFHAKVSSNLEAMVEANQIEQSGD